MTYVTKINYNINYNYRIKTIHIEKNCLVCYNVDK